MFRLRRPLRLGGLLSAAAGLLAVGVLLGGGGVAAGQERSLSAWTVASSIVDGQTLAGRLAWEAAVSGIATGSIARVEFSIDGALRWTEQTAPYRFNGDSGLLDTTRLANGSHVFFVRAIATDGTSASMTASAHVNNPALTAPHNTALPTISGEPRRGKTLTASSGSWSGTTPLSFSYRWLRCDTSASGCSGISGASGQSYTLGGADTGHRLRVRVRAANSAGASEATSEPTALVIVGVAPVNTSPPTISGSTQEGQTLTASPGSWTSELHVSYGYQWERCNRDGGNCVAIPGATSDRYKLTASEINGRLAVVVTATNEAGHTNARSAPSDVVVPAGTVTLPSGERSIPVTSVPASERLLIDRLTSQPVAGGVAVRFHVSDTRGYTIRDALVYVLALPYNWIHTLPEQPTGLDGTTSFTITPTMQMPKQYRNAVLFVRARRGGDNLLAGISTRRLVQVGLRAAT